MNNAVHRLIWKESRQQFAFWISGLTLSLLVLMSMQFSWTIGNQNRIAELTIGLTSLYIIAALATAFAGERELGTAKFLSILPVRFSHVVVSKILITVVGAIGFQLILLLSVVFGMWLTGSSARLPDYGKSIFHLFVLSPVEFLLWGIVFSTNSQQILRAIVLGVIASYASLGLLIGIIAPGMTNFDLRVFDEILFPRLALMTLLLGAAVYSLRNWCATLGGEMTSTIAAEKETSSSASQSQPSSSIANYSRLIWMSARCQWQTMACVLLIGINATLVAPFLLRAFELPETIPIVGMFVLLGLFAFRAVSEKTNVEFFGQRGVGAARVVNAHLVAWSPAVLFAIGFVTVQQLYPSEEFAAAFSWQESIGAVSYWREQLTMTMVVFCRVAFHGMLLFLVGALSAVIIRSTAIAFFLAAAIAALVTAFVGYCFMLNLPVVVPGILLCLAAYLAIVVATRNRFNQLTSTRIALHSAAISMPFIVIVCLAIPIYRMTVEAAFGNYYGPGFPLELIVYPISLAMAVVLVARTRFIENWATNLRLPGFVRPKYLAMVPATILMLVPVYQYWTYTIHHFHQPFLAGEKRVGEAYQDFQDYLATRKQTTKTIGQITNSFEVKDSWTEDEINSFNQSVDNLCNETPFVIFEQTSTESQFGKLVDITKSQINYLTTEGLLVEALTQKLLLRKLMFRYSAQTAQDSYDDIKSWARDPRQTPELLKAGIKILEESYNLEGSFVHRVRAEYYFRWHEPGNHEQLELTPVRKRYAFCSSSWEKSVYLSTIEFALFSNRATARYLEYFETRKIPRLTNLNDFGYVGIRFNQFFKEPLNVQYIEAHTFAWNKKRRQKLLLVELALIGWMLENGEYPDSLEQLAPDYFDDVPNDPVSHAPFYYEPTYKTHQLFEKKSVQFSFIKSTAGPFLIECGNNEIEISKVKYDPNSELFELRADFETSEFVSAIEVLHPGPTSLYAIHPQSIHPLPLKDSFEKFNGN